MTPWMLVIAGYLIGSVPFAYLVTRAFGGGDIRRLGSGNVGGMNTFRSMGLLPGVLAAVGDLLKGAAVALLALRAGAAEPWVLGACAAAVAGHNYSVYLRFHGGKGLATTAGVLLALSPALLLYAAGVLALGALILRDTNAAAGVTALTLPAVFWIGRGDETWALFGTAVGLLIAVRHIRDFRAYRQGRRQVF